jgi:hypothetical protein
VWEGSGLLFLFTDMSCTEPSVNKRQENDKSSLPSRVYFIINIYFHSILSFEISEEMLILPVIVSILNVTQVILYSNWHVRFHP